MARPLVSATAAAIVLALVLLASSAAVAFRIPVVKFLFTPQAGYSSTCLSCGWHSGACGGAWGTALDFPASCSGGQSVYFRNFGFKPTASQEWFGWGTPFTDTYAICKTTYVKIVDTNLNVIGYMRYVHSYKTRDADMMMYVSDEGRRNEYVFAAMVDADNSNCPGWVWLEEQQIWYWPIHLHEYHVDVDGAGTFWLRDYAACQDGDRYPCGPQSPPYETYNPQDWENDWARALCIDDTDCDGWKDSAENIIGTDPEDACPDGSWDDAWPPDVNNDMEVNILDILMFKPKLKPPYDPRFDLNADGAVNILDVLVYSNEDMGMTCTNPPPD